MPKEQKFDKLRFKQVEFGALFHCVFPFLPVLDVESLLSESEPLLDSLESLLSLLDELDEFLRFRFFDFFFLLFLSLPRGSVSFFEVDGSRFCSAIFKFKAEIFVFVIFFEVVYDFKTKMNK